MNEFEVLLGIDRAARDTGRRLTMRVKAAGRLAAALAAERTADSGLPDPLSYTHAIHVRPVHRPMPAPAMALPLAA